LRDFYIVLRVQESLEGLAKAMGNKKFVRLPTAATLAPMEAIRQLAESGQRDGKK
jgi:hypothetical protein